MNSADLPKLAPLILYLVYNHEINQNPREASSRSRIFLISLYMCVCVGICVFMYLCHASWSIKNWHTYSHWPYIKMGFLFFKKISVTAGSLQQILPCHMEFPHISSIALYSPFLDWLKKCCNFSRFDKLRSKTVYRMEKLNYKPCRQLGISKFNIYYSSKT